MTPTTPIEHTSADVAPELFDPPRREESTE
ncbi:hypothetical protein SAMN05192561_12014 [Halopenitus malekzadehii]|uniref:Uncharacterized protein n=1 Tax=Halopenitus malekzadehii TaxID=1267564 RepID=A0A1H6JQQ7_9EURY|nr:hypothetical protein SAMN05192561_12014 [Halopenitus malekzadehii]